MREALIITKYNLNWTISVLLNKGDIAFILLHKKLTAYKNIPYGAKEIDNQQGGFLNFISG